MLFSLLTSLSLVLGAVGYVNASPLSNAPSAVPRTSAETCFQPKSCNFTESSPCSTEAAIDAALKDFTPKVSVFWGGFYAGSTIRPKAEACAVKYSSIGAATIGMVLCQDPNIAMPERGQLWDHASKTFAKLAHGRPLVALGEARFDSTSYFNIELPTLKENQAVTDITSIDVGDDCKETCYWHCNGEKGCPLGGLKLCVIQTVPPNTPPKRL